MMKFPKKKFYAPTKSKSSECEESIQDKCEALLDDLGLRYVHVPGHLQRYLRMQAPPHIARIASQAFKGIPDLLVFKKDGDKNECLLLELKTEIGRVTQSQIDWSKGLNLVVAHGWDEAQKIIKEFAESA